MVVVESLTSDGNLAELLRPSWLRFKACHAPNKLEASCHLPRTASDPSGADNTCWVAVSSHPASGHGALVLAAFRTFLGWRGRRGGGGGCDVVQPDDKLEDKQDILRLNVAKGLGYDVTGWMGR